MIGRQIKKIKILLLPDESETPLLPMRLDGRAQGMHDAVEAIAACRGVGARPERLDQNVPMDGVGRVQNQQFQKLQSLSPLKGGMGQWNATSPQLKFPETMDAHGRFRIRPF
jgi:hypothetical protein